MNNNKLVKTVLGDMPVCEEAMKELNNALHDTCAEIIAHMNNNEILAKIEELNKKTHKNWSKPECAFVSVVLEVSGAEDILKAARWYADFAEKCTMGAAENFNFDTSGSMRM